jgi:hypothetical protein
MLAMSIRSFFKMIIVQISSARNTWTISSIASAKEKTLATLKYQMITPI